MNLDPALPFNRRVTSASHWRSLSFLIDRMRITAPPQGSLRLNQVLCQASATVLGTEWALSEGRQRTSCPGAARNQPQGPRVQHRPRVCPSVELQLDDTGDQTEGDHARGCLAWRPAFPSERWRPELLLPAPWASWESLSSRGAGGEAETPQSPQLMSGFLHPLAPHHGSPSTWDPPPLTSSWSPGLGPQLSSPPSPAAR